MAKLVNRYSLVTNEVEAIYAEVSSAECLYVDEAEDSTAYQKFLGWRTMVNMAVLECRRLLREVPKTTGYYVANKVVHLPNGRTIQWIV